VVASNPELRERELLKRADIKAAITGALRSRSVEEVSATVAAELAALALSTTITCWAHPENTEEFGTIAHRVLRRLHAATAELK
jgi:hypothetical protein